MLHMFGVHPTWAPLGPGSQTKLEVQRPMTVDATHCFFSCGWLEWNLTMRLDLFERELRNLSIKYPQAKNGARVQIWRLFEVINVVGGQIGFQYLEDLILMSSCWSSNGYIHISHGHIKREFGSMVQWNRLEKWKDRTGRGLLASHMTWSAPLASSYALALL